MDESQQQRRFRNDNERPMQPVGNQGGWGASNDRDYGDTRRGSNERQGRSAAEFEHGRGGESQGFGADDDYSPNETRNWESTQRDERSRSGGSGVGKVANFAGRGPKGYVRSDERLKEDISERLLHHSQIDASDVSVEVKDGKVTLEGSVPSRQTKHGIEDLVDHVFGVKDIENRLRVGQSTGSSRDEQPNVASTATASPAKPRKDRE